MTTVSSLRAPAGTFPVLMYHSVPLAGGSRDDLQVPLDELRVQLETLRADGYRVTGLTDALRIRRHEPRRPVVALTFDDAYADFLAAAQVLTEAGCGATLYVPTAHVGGSGMVRAAGRLLTWDELAGLPPQVEIGSHSHHHRPLDVLSTAVQRAELETSGSVLAERLGAAPRSFCFPHGYADRRLRAALVAAGYTNACVIGRRLARPSDDVFAVPRVQVRPGTGPDGLRELVRAGEPGLAPALKELARPAWRVARTLAWRGFGWGLT